MKNTPPTNSFSMASSAASALAIAEQQLLAKTIATLKRAISDLKSMVDSLAPVDGDLVALLANLPLCKAI
jgi:ABC-type transporter Mla subunit MlaD